MRLQQFDAPKKSLGQAFEKAKQERNWFIFGLYEPKNGKIGKRPVLRSRPWITIGAQNAARLIYDEAVEFLEGVTKDAKHIKKYNKIMLELARGADNEARPMIGLALGYLARPGSAMVMCDLDDVLDPETGELTEDGAKEWGDLLELYEGYAEISSSKTGLRLLLPREEGDEEKSSASEIGSGCFVAKGEKGMVLTFDIWKDNGKLVSDDFGAVEIVDKIVSDREAARARRGRVGGAGDANWGDLGDAQAAFDEWGLIDLGQLHEILEAVPNEGIGREEWIGLMLAIKEYYSAFGLEEEAWALFDDWTSRREDGGAYDYEGNRAAWDGGGRRGGGSRTTMSSWLYRYHQAISDSSGGDGTSDSSGGDGTSAAVNWWDMLQMMAGDGGKNKPAMTFKNAEIIGRYSEALRDVVRIGIDGATLWRMRDWSTGEHIDPPVLWKDGDDYIWSSVFQSMRVGKRQPFIKWSATVIDRGLKQVKAKLDVYDPIRREIDSLPAWDGTSRIDRWLIDYCGAEDTTWSCVAGRKFLIGMIARGMHGGAKMDTALVLHGKQGAGKSTLCRILCGDDSLFTDRLSNVASKDSAQEVAGRWIVEIGEGLAIRKSDREAVKMFLSAVEDKYRPPFGRNVIIQPRRCVFIMTTNDDDSLMEDGRRFWPVTVDKINLDGLKMDRGQLLAEAKSLLASGEVWWLNNSEALIQSTEAGKHTVVNAWEPALWAILERETDVSLGEVLFALGVGGLDTQATWIRRQIGSLLKTKLGWEKYRSSNKSGDYDDATREWRYRRCFGSVPKYIGPSADILEFDMERKKADS